MRWTSGFWRRVKAVHQCGEIVGRAAARGPYGSIQTSRRLSWCARIRNQQGSEEGGGTAAAWLRRHGFPDVQSTKGAADDGVHIWGAGVVGHVEEQDRFLGRPVVQQIYGVASGLSHTTGVVFSISGYSSQAFDSADEVGVALFVLLDDGQVFSCNSWAHRIVESGRAVSPRDSSLTADQQCRMVLPLVRRHCGQTQPLRTRLRTVIDMLTPDEQVMRVTLAIAHSRKGLLTLTDRRLLWASVMPAIRSARSSCDSSIVHTGREDS